MEDHRHGQDPNEHGDEHEQCQVQTVTVNVSGNLGERFRALSTIRWLHNGSTSGLVKMRMTTYGLQLGSAQSETVLDDYCDGQLLT